MLNKIKNQIKYADGMSWMMAFFLVSAAIALLIIAVALFYEVKHHYNQPKIVHTPPTVLYMLTTNGKTLHVFMDEESLKTGLEKLEIVTTNEVE